MHILLWDSNDVRIPRLIPSIYLTRYSYFFFPFLFFPPPPPPPPEDAAAAVVLPCVIPVSMLIFAPFFLLIEVMCEDR